MEVYLGLDKRDVLREPFPHTPAEQRLLHDVPVGRSRESHVVEKLPLGFLYVGAGLGILQLFWSEPREPQQRPDLFVDFLRPHRDPQLRRRPKGDFVLPQHLLGFEQRGADLILNAQLLAQALVESDVVHHVAPGIDLVLHADSKLPGREHVATDVRDGGDREKGQQKNQSADSEGPAPPPLGRMGVEDLAPRGRAPGRFFPGVRRGGHVALAGRFL